MTDRFVVSVDVACFVLEERVLKVLLVRRTEPPFAGQWALPGGIVYLEESLDDAARRVLSMRTRLDIAYLEQLYTFGDPARDPRSRTIAVAYYALLPAISTDVRSGKDVGEIAWKAVDELPQLAFDHARMVRYALQRLRQKITYTPIVFHLLPETFTLADLREVHEAIEGRQYQHLSNFQALMRARWDLVRVPGAFDRRTRRPAQLYRFAGPPEVAGPPDDPEPDAQS
jgi:8-oxo-dGTP diphosphatase